MAVILDDSSTPIDMNTLAMELKIQGLPPYARPCFVRRTKHIEMTGRIRAVRRSSLFVSNIDDESIR
jgi:hypothetical protein